MNSLTVTVNGVVRQFPLGTTVAEVVATLTPSSGFGCAVARNGEVVPRSEWATAPAREGDRFEVLGAAAGG
jgi:sulfur carrier protein